MSLHNAEDHAAPTARDGEPPAAGSWEARRAGIAAQQAREAEARRTAVHRRLEWTAPGGLSLADLARRLGWPGGTTGVPALLRELAELGRAHEREGVWYAGTVPGGSAGGAAAPCDTSTGPALVDQAGAAPVSVVVVRPGQLGRRLRRPVLSGL